MVGRQFRWSRASVARQHLAASKVTAPEDVSLSGLDNHGHFVFTALVLDAPDTITVARAVEAPTAAA